GVSFSAWPASRSGEPRRIGRVSRAADRGAFRSTPCAKGAQLVDSLGAIVKLIFVVNSSAFQENQRTMDAPITKVNLKLLQSFMLVAEHKSFRAAADLTYRSQSAVSSQIKQLELQLGVPLFHRTTRSVRLTAAGEKLLTTTRRALREISFGLH